MDDHIKDHSPQNGSTSVQSDKKVEPATEFKHYESSPGEQDPVNDDLNDREDQEQIQIKATSLEIKQSDEKEMEEMVDDGEEDNILRKHTVKLSIDPPKQEAMANEQEDSPNSPNSPLDVLTSPKFND